MTVISSLVPIVLSLCDVIAWVKMMIIAMRRNKEQSRHTHVHALITRASFLNSRFFTQQRCCEKLQRKKFDTSPPSDFFSLRGNLVCVCAPKIMLFCV